MRRSWESTRHHGHAASSGLQWGGALTGVLVLVLIVMAPGADAAVSSWVFAAQPASDATPEGRVFEAGAGSTDGGSGVFYGGQQPGNSNITFADTWVNSASGWTPKCGTAVTGATLPCGPGPRSALGMATGPNGVLLYGGFSGQLGNGAPTGDMWQWNGTAWTALCSTANCGPGARAVLAMAGNGAQAVIYGGLSDQGLRDDTWVYDGTSWTQTCGAALPTVCGPGALAGASMAWDGTQFVLFGGTTSTDNTVPGADTWSFNGTTWTKLCGAAPASPCGPPGRVFGAFAYAHDNPGGISGAILAEGGDLFGGPTTTIYRDAWLWHTGTWTELSAPWSGSPITFPGNDGGPPPGTDPLIGVLAAEPATCSLVYLAAQPTGTEDPAQTFASLTFTGGRNRTGRGTPNGCTVPPAPVTSASASAAPTPTSATSAAAPTASTGPILAATGSHHIQALTALSILLIAAGAATITLARKPAHDRPEPPR